MKIIDLLNKIANGEEVPKKIKYAGIIWEYDNTTKDYINDDMFLIYKINSFSLNKLFEILEEEPRDIEVCGSLFTKSEYDKLAHSEEEKKIPEKLFFTHISNYNDQSVVNNNFNNYFKKTQETINQLIDYLKSKGE